MRPDERQAAVAYTYAWWLTGDDEAATTAVQEAIRTVEAGSDDDLVVALVAQVRERLDDVRSMCPASELALLHDGLGVPLDPAGRLASVTEAETTVQLAHGRLEALAETVRDQFAHPERLGGLAVGNPADVAHARQCESCGQVRVWLEQGRNELKGLATVSPPAGLLARLAGQAPAAGVAAPVGIGAGDAADADASGDPDTLAVHDVLDAPQDYEVGGDTPAAVEALEAAPAGAPAGEAGAVLDARDVLRSDEEAPPWDEVEPVPATRTRAAIVLAAAGIVTVVALVAVFAAAQDTQPAPDPITEQPAVGPDPQPPATAPATPPPTEAATDDPFGPVGQRTGFGVVNAGMLAPGETEIAPSGTTFGPQTPLRLAVDYENATDGVELVAVWRAGGEPYERLTTVVGGQASRHVWGLPVPPDGWPIGRHRITVTAQDGLVAAVDFRIRP